MQGARRFWMSLGIICTVRYRAAACHATLFTPWRPARRCHFRSHESRARAGALPPRRSSSTNSARPVQVSFAPRSRWVEAETPPARLVKSVGEGLQGGTGCGRRPSPSPARQSDPMRWAGIVASAGARQTRTGARAGAEAAAQAVQEGPARGPRFCFEPCRLLRQRNAARPGWRSSPDGTRMARAARSPVRPRVHRRDDAEQSGRSAATGD